LINAFIRLASVFSSNKILSRLKFVEVCVASGAAAREKANVLAQVEEIKRVRARCVWFLLLCVWYLCDTGCSPFPKQVGRNTWEAQLRSLCCPGCVRASAISPRPRRWIEKFDYVRVKALAACVTHACAVPRSFCYTRHASARADALHCTSR
jgi:hypothetical protein